MATINPGQFTAALGQSYGFDSVIPPFYITGATLTANAAAFPTLPFGAYPSLEIRLNLLGFTGADQATIRFNGDTGANYADRHLTAVAGGVVVVDAAGNTSITAGRIGGPAASNTLPISAVYTGINALAKSKTFTGRVTQATGAAGTAALGFLHDSIEWVNTTAQIISLSVQCLGANSFLAGSSIMIFGGY